MKRQTDPDVLLLQAAADPTRLEILRQLSASDAVCACDFTDCCAVSQPTISRHLQVLEKAGLVVRGKDAQWRPRAINAAPLAEANVYLERFRKL